MLILLLENTERQVINEQIIVSRQTTPLHFLFFTFDTYNNNFKYLFELYLFELYVQLKNIFNVIKFTHISFYIDTNTVSLIV